MHFSYLKRLAKSSAGVFVELGKTKAGVELFLLVLIVPDFFKGIDRC